MKKENHENSHININGFREYDARWLYPKDINQEGIKNIGKGLGSQIISKTNKNKTIGLLHIHNILEANID